MLFARALHLDLAPVFRRAVREGVPQLLPSIELRLLFDQRGTRSHLTGLGVCELWMQPIQRFADRSNRLVVGAQLVLCSRFTSRRVVQIALELPHALLVILDRLLGTGDVRPELVIATLNFARALRILGELLSRPLDRDLHGSQRALRSLEVDLAPLHAGVVSFKLTVEILPTQGEKLGRHAPLFVLQGLVSLRRPRLALQLAQLALQLLAQVKQPVEIVLRASNAILGLATTLLGVATLLSRSFIAR